MHGKTISLLVSIASIATASSFATDSVAQSCGPRDRIAKELAEKYHEQRVGIGVMGGKMLVEVWTNEQTGTFTITRTDTKGVACLVAGGSDFTFIAPVPKTEGS